MGTKFAIPLGVPDLPPVGEADELPTLSAAASLSASEPGAEAVGEFPAIEGYQIVGPLGRGGMGTVWRAWQLSTKRQVALKLLGLNHFGSERAKRRFDREIELTSR